MTDETDRLAAMLGIPRLSGTPDEIDDWARGVAKAQLEELRNLRAERPDLYAQMNRGRQATDLMEALERIVERPK